MRIERHRDGTRFAQRVAPYLLRDEARFNLELAVLDRVARGLRYAGGAEPVLLTAGDAPAMMTPPFNLLMAAIPAEAAPALAEFVHAEGIEPPGALGEPGSVTAFAERYAAAAGATYTVAREQGIYELREVVPPAPVPGALREATMADLPLVEAWAAAFEVEVELPPGDLTRIREKVADRLFWLWDDGGPVCLAGCGGFTPNGARIGPVYTPPEHRGRGYASAATAEVTQLLLDRGRTSAFLYTDLANPTSNKIYRAIGYRHVTDVREVTFAR